MKFVDEAILYVAAGKGGDGSKSFRREKFVPFGGPDGGDGGKGGSVYLVTDPGLNTLVDFRYIREAKAEDGECGHARQCFGKNGKDKIIRVPVGTMVYEADTEELLGDLTEQNQKLLVAKGGNGGFGNVHFKSSTNRAPNFAIPGKPGDARTLRLELKLLADVGLLGLPNAGKSTFLSSISQAKPKIADYPFTTLTPQLGTVRLAPGQSYTVADIPGIIEGAHQGAGLGLQFLKHLMRTKLLLNLVDISTLAQTPPLQAIALIEEELKAYAPALSDKPRWLILNKADTLDEEEAAKILQEVASHYPNTKVFVISSVARKGIEALLFEIWTHLTAVKEEKLDEI